jgi:hypothetical protein
MKEILNLIAKQKKLLLLLFPVFYGIASLYFRLILDDPSLRSVDPDYVYFMSGLNIAEGHIKVSHIDHPGTPLQYLVAIVFRVIYWLRTSSFSFTEDVFRNPDLYLSMVNLVINLILSLALFAAGKTVTRKTGSVLYGMLVQTIPLVSVILYEIIGRVSPEQILCLPVIALTVFMIGHAAGKKEQFSLSELGLLSLIIGFGLSVKLTLLPLFVIPWIILKSWRSKFLVTLLSVVFFLIIAFPVTLQLERFWTWTKDLFLHSGQYGTGSKNILDASVFKENFSQMIRLQIHFSVLWIILLGTTTFTLIRFRKQTASQPFRNALFALAVLLTVFLQAFISAKQYAPRYFMPALMFGPLMIYLFIEIIRGNLPTPLLNKALQILLALFLIWTFSRQVAVIRYTSEAFQKQIKARKMTRDYIRTFEPGSIRIIASQDYGSPFAEYALQFSVAWSKQSLKQHYNEILGRIYPDTYQFTTWDGNFIHWAGPFDTEKYINFKIPVYLYLEKNSEELYKRTTEKLAESGKNLLISRELLFENQVNGEVLYKLQFSHQEPK